MQPLWAALLNVPVSHGPTLLGQFDDALVSFVQLAGQQFTQSRVEFTDLDQRYLAVDLLEQAAALGVGHGIAVVVGEYHLAVGGDAVAGQGGREIVERQVGADHRGQAAASGQCGTDFLGGEEQIGRGGDLSAIAARALEPVALPGIVRFAEFLPAAELVQ